MLGCTEDDAEFDLIAAAEPEPEIRPPTVFLSKSKDATETNEEPYAEIEDSRISSLREMGFTAEQAEGALASCNGDVNEALTLLLST